jgi:hypothetical protein
MEGNAKVYIDKRVERVFRTYKEGNHALFLYGIDNVILGTWNNNNSDFSEFNNILPSGLKIIGVILIAETSYEDFDAMLSNEIGKLNDCPYVQNTFYILNLCEVMYLDDFDAISFQKSVQIENLDTSGEKDVECVVSQADCLAKLADGYNFIYTDIKVTLNAKDTNDDTININHFQDIKDLLNNVKTYNIFLEDKNFFLDDILNMSGDKIAHLKQFLEKLGVNQPIRSTVGIKTGNDALKSFSHINFISEGGEEKINHLSFGGYVSKTTFDFKDFISQFGHIVLTYSGHYLNNKHYDRLVVKNDIILSHYIFGELDNGMVVNDKLYLDTLQLLSSKFIRKESQIGVAGYVTKKLVNVHHNNKKPISQYGYRALCKGDYEYFHYCQDGENDKGWGCAYRSLQTLFSWFLLNGFNKEGTSIPSIETIQRTLVKIGDKDPKIIGSNDWIGAMEVSYILNELLGVESSINFVSSGKDLDNLGRELIYHFETQGTPIMIGGGVYAYTILGVEYDRVKGNCNFLILDPHYPGDEDVKTIISKGWCDWKTVDLFDKNSFYNLCMPQLPK